MAIDSEEEADENEMAKQRGQAFKYGQGYLRYNSNSVSCIIKPDFMATIRSL